MERSHSGISQSCFGGVKLTVATGVAYFLAARLGLVLRVDPGVAVFWPASGIAIGALIALGPKAAAIAINSPTASPLQVWGFWFAASSLGIVTVAPLLIGSGDAMRERLVRHEQIEGWAGLLVVGGVTAPLVSLPDGPWATALPEALVFPFLLWIAIRCRPVFAAGAALTVGLTIIGSATLNIGYFDSGKPIAERILSAQILVFMEAILVVLLAAVFTEKRRSEQAVKQVAERLQLALDGAVLGAFSADLATGQFACDMRAGWSEVRGPSVMTPQHSGFGMSTIRDLIPYEFGGTVDPAFAASGVRCRLEIPADWLITNAEPPSKTPAHAFLRTRDPELETS